jgi:hypothetical protein
MLSVKSIHGEAGSPLEHSGQVNHREIHQPESSHHISPTVAAHELNTIFTIVQGYADRLALKHLEDPKLVRELKLITEAMYHASMLVQKALNRNGPSPSPHPSPISHSIR